MIGKLFFLT